MTESHNYKYTSSKIHVIINIFILFGFILILTATLYSREFSGPDGPSSFIFARFFSGFRWIDVVIISFSGFVFLFYTPFVLKRKSSYLYSWRMGSYVLAPLILFTYSIIISMIYGMAHGGRQLFFEWRAIALGVMFATGFRLVLSRIVLKGVSLYTIARIIFYIVSVHSLLLIVKWVKSGGVPPYNGPVFDGPTLSNAVAATSLGVALVFRRKTKNLQDIFDMMLVIVNILLVLTALRRTYWGELSVVAAVGFFFLRHSRLKIVLLMGLGVLVFTYIVPKNVQILRIESIIHFYNIRNPYASTNIGHLEDVKDAYYQVKNSPIWGIGLGTTYITIYTEWKKVSWGVHNGPLHVWLRFGLLGLVSYLWFHWRVLRFLWVHRKLSLSASLMAYWIGIFVPPLFFSPWPYGALQNTMLLGVLFALVDVEVAFFANKV